MPKAEGKTEAPAAAQPKAQVEWPPRQEGTPEGKDDPIPVGAGGREGARVDGYIQVLIEELSRPANMRRIRYVGGEETRPREAAGSVEAGEFQAPLPNVGAGDALYARVLYDVNSDYPGPVMLQILQQPLYGAVARGEFQLIRDRLVVRVTALDVAGETVGVDAVAVGLDCACYGLAGGRELPLVGAGDPACGDRVPGELPDCPGRSRSGASSRWRREASSRTSARGRGSRRSMRGPRRRRGRSGGSFGSRRPRGKRCRSRAIPNSR